MNARVIAAIAIAIGGFVVGSIASAIVRRALQQERRPPAIKQVAVATATFVFWAFAAFGLLVTISMTSPETLKPIPARLVAYFPRLLVAGVLLLLGNVLGTLVALAANRAAMRTTGQVPASLARIVKASIVGAAVLLAVSQLGIDTTIVTLLVAAVSFSIGLAGALLVGLGGRDVAAHLAAGRYVRRVVQPGDVLETGETVGEVLGVHAASIEVSTPSGDRVHVPHRQVLAAPFRILSRGEHP